MFTIPVEGIVNCHEKVYRSALVGIGPRDSQRPVIIVEPWPEHWTSDKQLQQQLIDDVKKICKANEVTSKIEEVLLKKKLPVDIRHNSKIFREQLRSFAEQQLA